MSSTLKNVKTPPESIKIEMLGGMLRFSKKKITDKFPFRKFNTLAETVAVMDKDSRHLIYKMLCGLILTAHTRHTPQREQRKQLFDIKNKLILSLIDNPATRRKLMFRLIKSPRVKVLKYCENCEKSNKEKELAVYKWKHCRKCETQRGYYDVIALQHKFPEASITLFLGSEFFNRVPPPKKGFAKTSIDKVKEELTYKNYHFRTDTGLFGVDLAMAMKVAQQLLAQDPPMPPGSIKTYDHDMSDDGPFGDKKPFHKGGGFHKKPYQKDGRKPYGANGRKPYDRDAKKPYQKDHNKEGKPGGFYPNKKPQNASAAKVLSPSQGVSTAEPPSKEKTPTD